jgi:hypothetical protein
METRRPRLSLGRAPAAEVAPRRRGDAPRDRDGVLPGHRLRVVLAGIAAAGVLVALARPDAARARAGLGPPPRVPGDRGSSSRATSGSRASFSPRSSALDLLLLLYRGMSHRARRDDLQIVVLGLFLIVVAGVLTVSLLFAAQILVFTACALGLLLVVTIAASSEGGQAPMLAVRGVVPLWAAHADWGRLFRRLREISDWRIVLAGGVPLLRRHRRVGPAVPHAIPRFQLENSLFLERFVTKKAMTGFNDSIKFGDITEITQDDGIAFDVDVSDPAQAPSRPYWRMVVLDEYHERRLHAVVGHEIGPRSAARRPHGGANLRPGREASGTRGAPTWTFYVESGISRYLPVLGRFGILRFRVRPELPVLLGPRHRGAAGRAGDHDGLPGGGHGPRVQLMLHDPIVRGEEAGPRPGRDGRPQLGLDVPAADQGVRAAPRPGDRDHGRRPRRADFAQKRAMTWLRQDQHPYSLAPRIPAGPGDPLIRWMSSREPGHCELFAGALVLLARSAGIPARVVTGFKGGTWNAYSGNYTIRNSDAHAWAELWDPTRGRVAAGGSAGDRRRRSITAPEEGAAALAGLHGPQLVGPAQQPAGLLVPADRELRPAVAGRHPPGRSRTATDTSGKWLRSARGAGRRHQGLVPRALGRGAHRADGRRRRGGRGRSHGSWSPGAGGSRRWGGAAGAIPSGARPGGGSCGSRRAAGAGRRPAAPALRGRPDLAEARRGLQEGPAGGALFRGGAGPLFSKYFLRTAEATGAA